jgi:hypothetical protein
VFDNKQGKNVSVTKVLTREALRELGANEAGTFKTRTEAKRAREEARRVLARQQSGSSLTLREFWEKWTTDPLYARPKESTNLHNKERITLISRPAFADPASLKHRPQRRHCRVPLAALKPLRHNEVPDMADREIPMRWAIGRPTRSERGRSAACSTSR